MLAYVFFFASGFRTWFHSDTFWYFWIFYTISFLLNFTWYLSSANTIFLLVRNTRNCMFHEMTLKLYFMKFSERKLSQCILPLIELNSLCKHIKQVRSSQPTIVYTKLNKTQFFPVSIVKTIITTVTPENLEDGGTREVWEKGQNQLHLTSDGNLYIFGCMREFQFQIPLHGRVFCIRTFQHLKNPDAKNPAL